MSNFSRRTQKSVGLANLRAIRWAANGRGCVKTQNTSIDLDLGRVHGFWPSIKHFWLGQQFCFGNL